jgi:ketosteroid isomerase-like protein
MKTATGLAILAATTLTFTGCQLRSSSPTQFTAADEAEVRSLFDSTVTRVNAANWTAWAGEFSDSAVMHQPNAKAIRGRPALLAFGQSFPPLEQFRMWDVQVAGDGNLAYGTSAIGWKLKGAAPDTLKQLVVFRRAPTGRWEVVAVSVTSDLPQAPAPAANKGKA